MKLKKLLMQNLISISLTLGMKSVAFAQENSAGDRLSQGYSGKVDFHSASHLARWQSFPLHNSHPHLTMIFGVMLIVGIIIIAIPLFKKKHIEVTEEVDLDELRDKRERLQEKINSLDSKRKSGELDQAAYQQLKEICIKQIKKIDIQLEENNKK